MGCTPDEIGRGVELLEDLTQYHPGLKPGVKGIIVEDYARWAMNSEEFVSARFHAVSKASWDILRRGLRFTDTGEMVDARLTDERARRTALAQALKGALGG